MWLQRYKHFGKNVHGCGDMKSILNRCAFIDACPMIWMVIDVNKPP